jgi:hypothetical protein
MTRPMVAILDCTTKETVVREMNDEEYAQHEIDRAAEEKTRLAEQALTEEPTE